MSSSNFGLIPLQVLSTVCLPVVVYTKPSAPRDRYQHVTENPIATLSKKMNIPCVAVQNMQGENSKTHWLKYNPNLVIVAGFGHLIPEFYLNPHYGCWNIHASLLPRWRGAAPIERAILAGDNETGISIMRVVSKLDAGSTIAQKSINMNDLNAKILHECLSNLGAHLMKDMLSKIIKRDFVEKIQDVNLVTYADKIQKSEFRLNWQKSNHSLYRQILAFPGKTWCLWRDKRFIVHGSSIIDQNLVSKNLKSDNTICSGSVIIIDNRLIVVCGNGYLELTHVQLAERRVMTAEDFIHGYQQNAKSECLQ